MPRITEEEFAKYPPPPRPKWIELRNLLPDDKSQISFCGVNKRGDIADPYWWSNPGPQTWALMCPYDEIMIGGERGGSKSAALIAWMAMGDVRLDPKDPAHYSYLLEPSFRGLLLKKEYQTMAEFVDECAEFYRPLGGKPYDDPVVFKFPSGAKIYTNHLADRNAFEKYRGQGITKIGIEELGQIEEEGSYKKLLGSLRAKRQIRVHEGIEFPALRSQIMSTANPDGPGKCVPYGDVLTSSGWKDIRDISVGDMVWSLDPVTGAMVEQPVDQVHSENFTGELYESKGRGLSVICTPDHKILRFNTTKTDRKLVLQAIKDFPGQATIARTSLHWSGSGPSIYTIPPSARRKQRGFKKQPFDLAIEQFAALVGWMVTEGSVVKRDNALSIAQVKPEGREILKSLLDKCGFQQNWASRSVLIYSHEWTDAFEWLPNRSEKYLPVWIKNLPIQALQCLFDAMVDGDGHRSSASSGSFFSSSSRLAADFCEIALKCGYMVLTGSRDRNGDITSICGTKIKGKLQISHEVSYHRQAINGSELRTGNHKYSVETTTKRPNTHKTTFSGPVYCIGVRNTHTFFVRQNGCVWVSGNSWVKKRFVKVYNEHGVLIPANKPMRDTNSGLYRIFIPMGRKDNPYLRNNKQYEGMLREQDEATYKAWALGDWDADAGTFFQEFRSEGPLTQEEREKYPWARHVVEPKDLKPWWYRFGGGDWGYDHPAAYHKFCKDERDGRIHCYDELMMRQCGSFEQGVRLAQWWLPDLEQLPDKTITIAFSSDAFSKSDDGRTKAGQISEGINKVLGPYGSFLLHWSDEERLEMQRDPALAERRMRGRLADIQSKGKLCIVLKPASKDVVARWSFMHDLLRFRPVVQETEEELKQRLSETYSRTMADGDRGAAVVAYERELSRVKRTGPEHLPRLQIWKGRCPQLVRCMGEAQKDELNPEKIKKFNATDGRGGDDALESVGHGLHFFKEVEKVMPKSYYVSERMEQIQELSVQDSGAPIEDLNRLITINHAQAARYDERIKPKQGSFYIPRASSSRHRSTGRSGR